MKHYYIAGIALVGVIIIAFSLHSHKTTDTQVTEQSSTNNTVTVSSSQLQLAPKVSTQISNSSKNINNTRAFHADHDHSDDAETTPELPQYLEDYVEQQRLPAEQLAQISQPQGTVTVRTNNQWSTVVMAVLDDDGKLKTVERQIQPIGTLTVDVVNTGTRNTGVLGVNQ